MAPEQVRSPTNVDGAADIFALGCVLYECLAARPAFIAENDEALFARILLEQPAALSNSFPAALIGLVNEMLRKRADERPTAASALQRLGLLRGETSEDLASLRVGDIVAGKYVVGEEIGRGGMGRVLAATHKELGTQVALKVLQRSGGTTEIDHARFLREARAAAQLESAHIARVMDVGKLADGTPYIVMDRLRGEDLAARLKRADPITVIDAVGLLLETAEGVADAHALGIVHRDIKPSNIFLTKRRNGLPAIKVLDFGISKVTRPLTESRSTSSKVTGSAAGDSSEASMSMTSPTAVMGSAAYMSPEQLRASKDVDVRTDIWALGVVLYELLARRKPFVSDRPAALGALIVSESPAPIDAPPELCAVVMRCLEKDPDDRYDSIAALAQALAPHGPPESDAVARRIAAVLGVADAEVGAVEPGAVEAKATSEAPTTRTQKVLATDDKGETSMPGPAGPRPGGRRVVILALAVGTALIGAASLKRASDSAPATLPVVAGPATGGSAATDPRPRVSTATGAESTSAERTSAGPSSGETDPPSASAAASVEPNPSAIPQAQPSLVAKPAKRQPPIPVPTQSAPAAKPPPTTSTGRVDISDPALETR